MRFEGKHGYHDWELQTPQPFEIDVELVMNLQAAGVDDDLTKTVDYGRVYDIARQVVESTSFRLLEAIAEAISHAVLVAFDVQEVGSASASPPSSSAVRSTTRRSRYGDDRRGGSLTAVVSEGDAS
jgi:7,8-dihydroneopterin aldolase/epimerase/oxygenase